MMKVGSHDALYVLFLNMANGCGDKTVSGRRRTTAMMLATVSSIFIFLVMFAFAKNGMNVLTWVIDAWPWRSDSARDFRSVGWVLLLLWMPLFVFWMKVGERCKSEISLRAVFSFNKLLGMFWMWLNIMFPMYISLWLGMHVAALVIQPVVTVLLVTWWRQHPV